MNILTLTTFIDLFISLSGNDIIIDISIFINVTSLSLMVLVLFQVNSKNTSTKNELNSDAESDTRPLNIMLIHPNDIKQQIKPTRLPLGLMYLASALQDKKFLKTYFDEKKSLTGNKKFFRKNKDSYPNFNIKIIDIQVESIDFDLRNEIKNFNPDVVGITSVTPMFAQAKRIAQLIRDTLPTVIIIIGGVHVSSLPEKVIQYQEFTIGVIGEGEETFVELCMEISSGKPDFAKVDGICYRDERGELIINKFRNTIMTLDSYPFPSRVFNILNRKGYKNDLSFGGIYRGQSITLISSRGCPWKCSFCATSAVFKKIRLRSAINIFEEIDEYYRLGFRLFNFESEVFNLNKKLIVEFCNIIVERNLDIEWYAMIRANNVDREMLIAMKHAGCQKVALGAETGDQKILNSLNKNLTLRDIVKTKKLLDEVGINCVFFMMLGLPNQTWESLFKTVDFLEKLTPFDKSSFAIAMPYPGSSLFNDPNIRMLGEIEDYHHQLEPSDPNLKELAPPNIVTETNVMSTKEIKEAFFFMIKIDKNWKNEENLASLKENLKLRVIAEKQRKIVIGKDGVSGMLCGNMNTNSIKDGIIAIDVGGTKVTAGILATNENAKLIKKNGEVIILIRKTISTYVGDISILYDEICDLIKDVESCAPDSGVKIIKVLGVSHAGKFKKDGTIDFGDSGWDGVAPAKELSKRINNRIFLINDALAQMYGSIDILLSNPDLLDKIVNRKVCYIGPGTGLGGGFMEIGDINERRFLDNDGHVVDIVMQEEPYKFSIKIDDVEYNITLTGSKPTAVKLISGRSIRSIMCIIDKTLLEEGKQPVFLPFVSGFISMSIKEQLDLLSADSNDLPLNAKLLNLSILEHINLDNSYIRRALPVAKMIAIIQGVNLGRLIEKIFNGEIEKGFYFIPQTEENIESILRRIQWTQEQINEIKGITSYIIGGSIGNKGELSRIILKEANLYLKKTLTEKIELIRISSDTDKNALIGVGLLLNEA